MTGLGDTFGAPATGEVIPFGLANGALDCGEFAGCGIVATHADKTKDNVTLIAPLTTVLIMDFPGFPWIYGCYAWVRGASLKTLVCRLTCSREQLPWPALFPWHGFAGVQRH